MQAEPVLGLWDQNRVRNKLEDIEEWRFRLGVELKSSRRMVRKLAWEFPEDEYHVDGGHYKARDRRLRWMDWMTEITSDRSDLCSVEELHFILDDGASRYASLPSEEVLEDFLETRALPPVPFEATWNVTTIEDELLLMAIAALRFFASCLPSICVFSVSGIRDLANDGAVHKWFGGELELGVLPEDCIYLQEIKEIIENMGKKYLFGGVRDVRGRCRKCMSPWTENHWTRSWPLESDVSTTSPSVDKDVKFEVDTNELHFICCGSIR